MPVGTNVTIYCDFIGDSVEADINWLHNNTYYVDEDDPHRNKFVPRTNTDPSSPCLFSPSLTINSATVMESGSYLCVAVTTDGVDVGTNKSTTLGTLQQMKVQKV